jgi:hypothetical protein
MAAAVTITSHLLDDGPVQLEISCIGESFTVNVTHSLHKNNVSLCLAGS